ncbi:hypothetical protein XFF6994_240002 [Xanthomonas citri pv. fuscans]|nr:conserved hypothetical protein [Xanthomonas citri pv. fuscans]SOO32850.1 hypothetical protein XFF6994_240002 [Xanthomonas citri pv. fuscans]
MWSVGSRCVPLPEASGSAWLACTQTRVGHSANAAIARRTCVAGDHGALTVHCAMVCLHWTSRATGACRPPIAPWH